MPRQRNPNYVSHAFEQTPGVKNLRQKIKNSYFFRSLCIQACHMPSREYLATSLLSYHLERMLRVFRIIKVKFKENLRFENLRENLKLSFTSFESLCLQGCDFKHLAFITSVLRFYTYVQQVPRVFHTQQVSRVFQY